MKRALFTPAAPVLGWSALAAAAHGYAATAWPLGILAIVTWVLAANARHRDRAALVFLAGVAFWPAAWHVYPPNQPIPPDAFAWLGTDTLGRDSWARLTEGFRRSSLIAVAAAAVATVIGFATACLLVFSPSGLQRVVRFGVQLFLSMPVFLLILPAVVFLPSGPVTLVLAMGCLLWPEPARLAEQQLERLAVAPFVTAARMRGETTWAVFRFELLPHLRRLLWTCMLLNTLNAVLLESILSYLGLGLPLGTPSLGGMFELAVRQMDRQPALLTAVFTLLLAEITLIRRLGGNEKTHHANTRT
ncbi:ABC transporter permease [Acanthopleuribacter pedis]|uniref:ABC transporter permease n=1 Tax=Acanthopleuribacter pedis TaxID=442870 RepID=A0A8J7Q6P7_9BACT|nr:ABC transporter permease subunit [Acanthopleuribacter pedis]MBO1321547.1 ABC transporter permease [Acanthopleuribacter pedis]